MELICDVWEGSLDIDEPILRSGGVVGLIIRLNDMNGGHHMDVNFYNQWAQAERFLRALYFVYNPWVNADINYSWLMDHMPKEGVTVIFADVEVTKAGYSSEVYADEVQRFYDLCSQHYHTVIYTGGWFLPIVSHWPNCEYWWARYPSAFYPSVKEYWTWLSLKAKVEMYGYYPDVRKQCPGTVEVWQLSGDRLILPGTANRAMDISVWNGDLASLEAWWGQTLPPSSQLTDKEKLDIMWREIGLHHTDWNLNP